MVSLKNPKVNDASSKLPPPPPLPHPHSKRPPAAKMPLPLPPKMPKKAFRKSSPENIHGLCGDSDALSPPSKPVGTGGFEGDTTHACDWEGGGGGKG